MSSDSTHSPRQRRKLPGHHPDRLTYDLPEVARMLGISRAKAYDLARHPDGLPVQVLQVGRRKVVPKAEVERLFATRAVR